MKKVFATLVLASSFAVSAFAADNYAIDSNHTFPVFEVNHLGYSTQHGRFNKTSGKITLDMAAKKGSVDLTIDVASLDMGFPTWDEHMAAEGFFNTAKFPTMTFKSNKLVFKDGKVVAAEGDFTMLGVTKPLTVTVKGFVCGDNPMNKKPMCGANISGTIKRSDFGMSKYVPAISDDIKIHVPVEAYKE
ncbi:MAG: YceI family protein [Gallionellaceae bacterium]|jgi:polyisoprenoid-binding protein YceI